MRIILWGNFHGVTMDFLMVNARWYPLRKIFLDFQLGNTRCLNEDVLEVNFLWCEKEFPGGKYQMTSLQGTVHPCEMIFPEFWLGNTERPDENVLKGELPVVWQWISKWEVLDDILRGNYSSCENKCPKASEWISRWEILDVPMRMSLKGTSRAVEADLSGEFYVQKYSSTSFQAAVLGAWLLFCCNSDLLSI